MAFGAVLERPLCIPVSDVHTYIQDTCTGRSYLSRIFESILPNYGSICDLFFMLSVVQLGSECWFAGFFVVWWLLHFRT